MSEPIYCNYYEINVAKLTQFGNYEHYFATHERSATTRDKAMELFKDLRKHFPAPQFVVEVTGFTEYGTKLAWERDDG